MSKSCAVCKKPVTKKYAPFCSKRCADIDLNRWFLGQYVIEGNEPITDDEDMALISELADSELY